MSEELKACNVRAMWDAVNELEDAAMHPGKKKSLSTETLFIAIAAVHEIAEQTRYKNAAVRRAEPENKPLTYYDEIRNMSLEEMATFLSAGWNHADYEDGDWDPEIMAMLAAPVRKPEGSCSMA